MVSIQLDDREVKTFFQDLKQNMKQLVLMPLYRAADYVRGKSQEKYLTAAGPTHLNVDTGRLRMSLKTESRISGNEVVGIVSADAQSVRGFDYGAYWEWRGTGKGHGGPRPFLTPARDQHQDEWMRVFDKAFKEKFEQWQSAKAY